MFHSVPRRVQGACPNLAPLLIKSINNLHLCYSINKHDYCKNFSVGNGEEIARKTQLKSWFECKGKMAVKPRVKPDISDVCYLCNFNFKIPECVSRRNNTLPQKLCLRSHKGLMIHPKELQGTHFSMLLSFIWNLLAEIVWVNLLLNDN